jgi:hypothetical protein
LHEDLMMTRTTRTRRFASNKYVLGQFCIALAALALLQPAFSGTAAPAWPQVPLPKQVQAFDVGEELNVNGTPLRMRGFVATASPAEVAASFRRLLGQPLMEDRAGASLVLGRAQGRYYLTVRLDALGAGTRGLVAVTRPPVNDEQPAGADAARRLLSALPPGSTLASRTVSTDGGKYIEHDAVINLHSIGINTEHITRMLLADGFALEREEEVAPAARTQGEGYARSLFFKRRNAEAIAVLSRDDSGRSVIVLNRTTFAVHEK